MVGTEDELVTLTCRKRLFATDLTDTVLQSRTPSVRGAASPVDEVVFDDGILRVIKAKVATAGSPKKFLRLEVTGN